MRFEPYHLYELKEPAFGPNIRYVVCVSGHEDRVRNLSGFVSFVPLTATRPLDARDPFRVEVSTSKRGLRYSTLYAAVNVIQSVDNRLLYANTFGQLSEVEIKELKGKLADWLGL